MIWSIHSLPKMSVMRMALTAAWASAPQKAVGILKGKANFEEFSKTGLHPRRSVRCLPLHKTHGMPASGSNCSSHRTEEKEAR